MLVYMSVNWTLSVHPALSFPFCVHKSVLYVCVSIPALQIGSCVPFVQIPYIHVCVCVCVNIWYLFFWHICVTQGAQLHALWWSRGVGERLTGRGSDSVCCTTETNTTLSGNYTPKKGRQKQIFREVYTMMKHKLESRLPGEISVISDMQMTPTLWQKVKN